jgi:hypothetical protein
MSMLISSARAACGRVRDAVRSDLGIDLLVGRGHRRVLAQGIENAPASRPAMPLTVTARTLSAAAAPAIKAV